MLVWIFLNLSRDGTELRVENLSVRSEKIGVFLDFVGNRHIDELHVGVLVSESDSHAAEKRAIDSRGDDGSLVSEHGGDGFGDFGFLFRSKLNSGGDLNWNFTGLGLEDSGVDLGDFGEEVHSVVLAKSLEKTNSGLGHASFASNGGEGGHLLVSADAWVAEEVSDLGLGGESTSNALEIGLDTGLVTTLLGGGVEGSGVRTSNTVSWDWGVEESPGGVDDLTSKHSVRQSKSDSKMG